VVDTFPVRGVSTAVGFRPLVVESAFVAVAARTDLAFQQCIDPACRATFSVDE